VRADACKLLRDWGVGCRGLAELRGKTRETGSVNAAAAAAAASEPADAPAGADCAQGAPLSKPLAEGEGAAPPPAPQGEPPRREQAARESLFGLGQRHGLCDKRGKLKAVQVGGRWGLSRVSQGSLMGEGEGDRAGPGVRSTRSEPRARRGGGTHCALACACHQPGTQHWPPTATPRTADR
jgi:hypothetical protein